MSLVGKFLALASLSMFASNNGLALPACTSCDNAWQDGLLSTNSQLNQLDQQLLAGGQIGQPQPVPMPSIQPPITGPGQPKLPKIVPPAETPVLPGSNELRPTKEGKAEPVPSSPQKVLGSVEYEESIPDTSGYPPLGVVDALNDALISSPRAAAIRAQWGVAQAGYAAVTAVPNPAFFFDRGMVAEQENRIGPILTEEPPWKLYFRFLIQKRTLDQTVFDLMTQLWQLRANVRRDYTEVVVAQETYKTLNELYDLAAKLEAVASKRFQAGDVPELDVLKARLATSQAYADRIVAAQRVIRARQQLNVIMGRPVDNPVNVPALPDYTGGSAARFEIHGGKSDVLPDFSKDVDPLPIYISIAESNRLELKSLAKQVEVNKANLKAAYGNMVPDPSLALGKSYGGNVPTGPKITAVFFTLNAPMPMTNVNQGSIGQFKATLRQLRFQISSQKNQVSSDVLTAYQNLLAARGKLQTYQEHVLADSFQVARLARRSYEVGQSDITATILAQQINVQTRTAYLDAVSNYQLSFTDLEQACGIPLQ